MLRGGAVIQQWPEFESPSRGLGDEGPPAFGYRRGGLRCGESLWAGIVFVCRLSQCDL